MRRASRDRAPVVLLHGNGSSWNSWALTLNHLGRVTLAPDLPGFGDSPTPDRFFSLSDYARTVLGLFQGPALLVGNSLGGLIALEAAFLAPDRVSGLVLVAVPACAPGRVDAALASLMSWVGEDGVARIADEAELSRITLQSDARVLALANANLARARNFLPALAAAWNYRWWERTPSLRCPVCIFWGDQDGLLGPDHLERWLEAVPSARVHRMEAAHSPQFDAPEEFNRLLTAFLDEVEGGSAGHR
ncbi:MAG: alpha/beta fold hydrolase [Candidatus Eremiobacterota bacterium]